MIEKISDHINSEDAQKMDADGRYVFPGFIDAHTHMGIPIRQTVSADNFESGTLAALYGGVTTIIDFTVQEKGESLIGSIKRRKEEAGGQSSVDYALHCNITDTGDQQLKEIQKIVEEGIISFKVFTAYREAGMQLDDRQIMEVLWQVKLAGGTVMVHAENGNLIDFLTDKYLKFNKTTPIYHAMSRPAEAEIEAVARITTLNQFILCPLYFVHLSTKEAVQIASLARQKKQPVYIETCPQFLMFDQSVYDQANGHLYIAAPPFRSKEDISFLWEAINNNWIDTVGTDHCPFTLSQKEIGQRQFNLTPNGLPGVETLFTILYNEGVTKDRLSLQKLVSLISDEPARLFGIFPKKGIIAEKSDADLVIFDPRGNGKITVEDMHSNTDWSPFEGLQTSGTIESVMLRGKWLLKNKKLQKANLKKGRFVPAR